MSVLVDTIGAFLIVINAQNPMAEQPEVIGAFPDVQNCLKAADSINSGDDSMYDRIRKKGYKFICVQPVEREA